MRAGHFIDAVVVEALLSDLGLAELRAIRAACTLLRSTARGPLVTRLSVFIDTGNARLRASALRALTGVFASSDRRPVQLAISCLRHNHIEVRRAAATVILAATASTYAVWPEPGGSMAAAAAARVRPALKDSDDLVCMAAARALPKLVPRGDKAAIDSAFACLVHSAATSRRAAVAVLGDVAVPGDASLVAAVAGMAQDDVDWHVRAVAVRALPQLAKRGDGKALAALTACLKDLDVRVRHVAMRAVVHIAERPSLPFIRYGPVGRGRGPGSQRMRVESPLSPPVPPARRRRIS